MEVAKLLNRTFLNPAQLLSARSTLKDAKKTANRRGPPVFVLHTSQKCMQCADMFTLWRHRHTCKSCGKYVVSTLLFLSVFDLK
jgi:Zn finger protein HypA/HybF involved in hydrogenase expression